MLAVAVAPACAVCDGLLHRPTAGPVCDACWHDIRVLTPPLCSVCGDPIARFLDHRQAVDLAGAEPSSAPTPVGPLVCHRCRQTQPLIARSRAVGEYSGTLRALVHLLKYEKRRSIAPRLAAMMTAAGADVLRGADAAVPVPLHWTRKWQRGFNQATLLAAHLGVPVWPALSRTRPTSAQVTLRAPARRLNVRGAFAVTRLRRPWRASWPATVKGKTVVLVDDVSTTGATLEACAKALRAAGVREVRALTAARVTGGRR